MDVFWDYASPMKKNLDTCVLGRQATVARVGGDGFLHRRLLNLGLVPGTVVRALFAARGGDPVAYRFRGTTVALRRGEASLVEVVEGAAVDQEKVTHGDRPPRRPAHDLAPAPGSGQVTVALAGNPNTGKSTVFNALCGLRQHTGNWPGKTVTRAVGSYRHHGRLFRLVDLPGTYSLDASSPDEEVARDFLLSGEPHLAAVVVDVTALERNLALALQVLDAHKKTVVCLNMMDEADRLGLRVDATALSRELDAPVVSMAARLGRGIDQFRAALSQLAAQDAA